jgi:hypothetical protein
MNREFSCVAKRKTGTAYLKCVGKQIWMDEIWDKRFRDTEAD